MRRFCPHQAYPLLSSLALGPPSGLQPHCHLGSPAQRALHLIHLPLLAQGSHAQAPCSPSALVLLVRQGQLMNPKKTPALTPSPEIPNPDPKCCSVWLTGRAGVSLQTLHGESGQGLAHDGNRDFCLPRILRNGLPFLVRDGAGGLVSWRGQGLAALGWGPRCFQCNHEPPGRWVKASWGQAAPPHAQSEGDPPSSLPPASRAGSCSCSKGPVTGPAASATYERYWGGAPIPGKLSPLGFPPPPRLTSARALERRRQGIDARL